MSLNHPIVFGELSAILNHFLQVSQFSSLLIFCDQNTEKHCLPKVETDYHFHTHVMPAGEKFKTINTTEKLWEKLLSIGSDRNSLLINLGGGVVTDLGGFAASAYKRGIRFVNIPTSLLAMVDASTGGKTGVNFGGVKNSIGAFSNPETVIIDESFLKTLPKRHLNNGIAEIAKHAFIAKKAHLNSLYNAVETGQWSEAIRESIKIKQQVVESDPYEKGRRKILNFGHTIGHAIESYSLKNDASPLLHGEAIAIGMIAEAYLSKKYCDLTENEYQEVIRVLKQFFTLKNFTKEAQNQMVDLMKNDKKNQENSIRMSLLKKIGEATYDVEVSEEDCHKSFEEISDEI